MNITNEQTISAIIPSELELEEVINELISESVARSDISVQGTPEQIKKKYGVNFLSPELIQEKMQPPTKEPYMRDDIGWLIGLSFGLPFFVCLVFGAFILADIRSTPDVWFYGTVGGLVGLMLGFFNAKRVKNNYERKWAEQEKQGGFVLWVSVHNEEQYEQVMQILKQHSPTKIKGLSRD